jgi:ATP-dependent DNA helicase RecG
MDKELAKKLVSEAEETEISKLDEKDVIHSLWQRGYLWEEEDDGYYGTAAGILLLGNNPTAVFTHARIQIAAFPGVKKTHKPIDHDTIRKPLPIGIDETVAFINKNTRHPLKVIGLNRVQVDEYPEEAIREALVNALAHRDYEDAGRRIEVNVFKDRIEIISPGDLPGGLSIRKLLSGQAKSRSRNPNIAQGLNSLDRMEER